MELNITELDNFDNSSFEQIPENNFPAKKNVTFDKPMHQTIPKQNAIMKRPKQINPRPQISYEDILSKMGLFVADGKLHLLDDKTPKQKHEFKQQIQSQNHNHNQQIHNQQYHNHNQQYHNQPQNYPQNSYIYNKYFKDELQPQDTVRKPKTKQEYSRMLLLDILQKQRINQIKSKKLIMPTININMAEYQPNNMNKLFHF